MQKIYKTNTETKALEEIHAIETDSWISLVSPTAEEIQNVVEATGIDADLLTKMLDDDELPRIETSGNATLVVIDVPTYINKDDKYTTYPLGTIITDNNYVITVSLTNPVVLKPFIANKVADFRTAKKVRFLIQIIANTASQYVKVLDNVYRDIERGEDELERSPRNEDLLRMLALEKSLVYFTTSLKENDAVLERLQKGIALPLYDEDRDLLDDAIIENRQAIDMSSIYYKILGSISETYATITNNNLNYAMKFLAAATIVLSIPTIISSFLGMNVPFGVIGENPLSATVIFVGSIFLSLLAAVWLRKKGLL